MSLTYRDSYHHGDLHNALIRSAVELIREHGPAELSLREVAKRAGVSHGAPYRHFRNKDALLQEIVCAGFRRLSACLRAVETRYADPRDQLVKAGVAYVELAVANPEITLLMFGGFSSPGCGDADASDNSEVALVALQRIIERGQSNGIFKSGDTRRMAMTCWSLIHGFSMLLSGKQLSSSPEDAPLLGEQLTEQLLGGLILAG